MSDIELNAILFYADYLSLQHCSQPVTDNCKYFFIYGTPINSAYILDLEPIYDPENKYLMQAYQQYMQIKERFSEDGVMSFIDDICFIRSCGMVDAERMLQNIHLFSTKQERKQAMQEYNQWKANRIYTHQTLDDNGNPELTECTQYFKHAEEALRRRNIPKSIKYA